MANWRKQQGGSHHHQVGHWRPFSHRRPPLDNRHSTVPAWEKNFCTSLGSISWGQLVERKKYICMHHNVLRWNDSAGKEAFDNAKMRYWAGINGISCDISMPDPDIYNDNVDWNATVDHELILDLEEAPPKVSTEEQKAEEIVYVDGKLFINQKQIPPTGWEDNEAEESKRFGPTLTLQGWESLLHENTGVESGQQLYGAPLKHAKEFGAPVEHAREYEMDGWTWRNDPWGWNHREHYGGDMHKMGRGRGGGGGGSGYNGYKKRENMPWSRTPNAYNGNNEYHHMNRGRRNNRGGRGRGNFVYVPKEVPTSAAW